MKKNFLFLFLILINASSLFAQGKVTPEFLWKLGRVSDPQVSPDGKDVLYNVRTFKLDANKGNSDVWKVNISSGAAVHLTTDSANETSAKWSTDGKKIFYLSDKGGSSQLWSMNADGSAQTKQSSTENDINAYGISANGSMIWMAMDVKIDKMAKDMYPDLPKTSGRVYDDLMFRHWDTWADGSYSHIFISKFENGRIAWTPKDIMKGERFQSPMKPMGGEEEIAWSADGKRIAYTSQKLNGREYALSTNSDIYIYDVEKGTTTNLTEGMMGYDKAPQFSPDGTKIIWRSQERNGDEGDKQRLFIYDFNTKDKKELTAGFDNYVESASFNTKGSLIYMLVGIKATVNLFVYDLNAPPPPKGGISERTSSKQSKDVSGSDTPLRGAGGLLKQLTNDVADHTAFSLSAEGNRDVIVTSRMSISEPVELFSIDPKSGESKQITRTNKDLLSTVKLGKVEKRMIKATDGLDILTWVIYPPDFDATKKYPTLLYCQGGPQSTVGQFFSYRWNFQIMAANGYIIVAPNRRGLPSFGQKWNDDITRDWGGQCMTDLLSSIDEVSKEPYVNKDKLGCVGASFGGYSAFWLAGHHNKRFKAFISHDGVFNLESMYGATEELWFPDWEYGGPYWKNPVDYDKFSPHKFVKNWDTPILIITNEKDYRVPLEQGLEAYTAARVQNIPARLLTFPDEGHWVSKPQNSVLWQRVFFEWLDKYLK